MSLTYQKYQKQRMKLIEIDSSYDPSTEKWKHAHEELEALDEQWKMMPRELIISDVRIPHLGDLEADCDEYGTPICMNEHIAAAFVCRHKMYFLRNDVISSMTAPHGYLPANMEMRLVITIKNASEYTLVRGAEFVVEGNTFRMINDKDAIMTKGYTNPRSWSNVSYLYGQFISEFLSHQGANTKLGATFTYQPNATPEDY